MNNNPYKCDLSVVCTVYNDREIVPLLVKKIKENICTLNISYEIILVNDHSTDQSESAIQYECEKDKNVKGITLSRNFGQQIAISSGVRYATGKYIVIMDGDLQNPPESIPLMYQKILEGYDIIYTASLTRDNLLMKWASQFFWFLITSVFKIKIVKNQLMLRIMTHQFASYFNQYEEITRAVGGITNDIGFNYYILQVENLPRSIGKSKTSFLTRVSLLLDLLINLTYKPLNALIYIGIFGSLISLILMIVEFYLYFAENIQPGYTSIILSIFFFGSLIIFMLGIIGRYVANIYIEVKKRPLFIVQKTYNMKE